MSLAINHPAWLCVYMTQGQGHNRMQEGVRRLGSGTQTFAPGAPVDLNEEVPHSGGYQVTN